MAAGKAGQGRQQDAAIRERALKLFPWICGRCGREFSGKRVAELTVHHKDHDHDNNPPDGSNWELLCIYCHDAEHTKHADQVRYGAGVTPAAGRREPAKHNPLAALGDLLKRER